MDSVCGLGNGHIRKNATAASNCEQPGGETAASAFADTLAQQVVRAEANFLRLPLFTLDNKHMRTMDGLRCEGTFRRGSKSFAFSYSVTRNTAT